MKKALFLSLRLGVLAVILSGCAPKNKNRVVLYCSVDEVYAKPLIKKLEAQTGLQIDALFDTEATKTAGLANRIRAEASRPRADVFWSSALLQTLLMSDEKLLQPYDSPSARDLPARFRGKDWVAVGARARLQVSGSKGTGKSNLALIPMTNPVAISNPQFGTASDWATAWATRWGQKSALNWFKTLKIEPLSVLPGNGDVARAVADGTMLQGWTDTDDFLAEKRAAKKIFVVETVKENVLVPGAVSMLKNAPHLENAKKLLDAIASAQNERALTLEMPGVFSLRHLDEKSNFQSGSVDFSFLQSAPHDDYTKWAATWRQIREPLNQIFASK